MSDETPILAGPPPAHALDADSSPTASATERVIEKFGGIRPMAAKLDVPVTTVQGWKKRGAIPQARHADILAAAEPHGIALDRAELGATDPNGSAVEIDPVELEPLPGEPDPIPAATAAAAASSKRSARTDSSKPVPPAAGRDTGRLAWGAAVVAVLAAAVSVVAPFVAGKSSGDVDAKLAQVESRIPADLAPRVAALEARPAAAVAPGAGAADPALAERLTQLEQQLQQTRTQTGDLTKLAARLNELQVAAGGRELLLQSITDIQASLVSLQGLVKKASTQAQTLTERMDKVESQVSERRVADLRNEAVVLAVGQLRQQTQTAHPFDKQIAALRAMAGEDPMLVPLLDRIQDGAEAGVPTREELRAELTRIAPEIVRSAKVGDGSSWLNQAMYRVSSVISIRRVGANAKGDGANAAVARAEAMVDADDVAGAVASLKPLTGLAGEVARPWVRAAERRMELDAAAEEMSRLMIDRLAADPTKLVVPAGGGGNAPANAPPASAPPANAPPALSPTVPQ